MKKIIYLAVLLLSTISTYAQEPFALIYGNKYMSGEWVSSSTLFQFEEGLNKMYIEVLPVGFDGKLMKKLAFTRNSDPIQESTTGGYKFTSVIFKDDSTGKLVSLQIFEKEEYGIRIAFSDGSSVQFNEVKWTN